MWWQIQRECWRTERPRDRHYQTYSKIRPRFLGGGISFWPAVRVKTSTPQVINSERSLNTRIYTNPARQQSIFCLQRFTAPPVESWPQQMYILKKWSEEQEEEQNTIRDLHLKMQIFKFAFWQASRKQRNIAYTASSCIVVTSAVKKPSVLKICEAAPLGYRDMAPSVKYKICCNQWSATWGQ